MPDAEAGLRLTVREGEQSDARLLSNLSSAMGRPQIGGLPTVL